MTASLLEQLADLYLRDLGAVFQIASSGHRADLDTFASTSMPRGEESNSGTIVIQ